MPTITAEDGCPINVEVEGRDGAPGADAVEFARHQPAHVGRPGAEFVKHFRLVRYDRRGHGKSGAPKGPYNYGPASAATSLAVARRRSSIKNFNWCGLSMGGMVGQWLGANAPRPRREARPRQHAISTTPTSRRGPTASSSCATTVSSKLVGPQHGALVHQGLPRARAADDRAHDRDVHRQPTSTATSAASRRSATWTSAPPTRRITTPTLVIVGKQDPATPPAAGEDIAKPIKGAKIVALDAAHISNIEQPKAFTDAVLNFLLN